MARDFLTDPTDTVTAKLDQSQADTRYVTRGTLWTPRRSNVRGANFDPAAASTVTALTTGRVFYFRVPIAYDDAGTPLAKILFSVGAAGATLTDAVFGVYNLSGSRLARTSDLVNGGQSVGLRTISISPDAGKSLVPTPGSDVIVACLWVGTTAPTLSRGGVGTGQLVNYPYVAGTDILRFGQGPTAATDIPASLDATTWTVNNVAASWIGLN